MNGPYCEPEAKDLTSLTRCGSGVGFFRLFTMPPDAQEIKSLRIVVRPHLNQDLIEILARDIESACEYLEQHGGTATPPKLHDAHKTSAKC
jgi:hypothetical protein